MTTGFFTNFRTPRSVQRALQAGKVPIGHLPWRFCMRCTVKRSCPTGPGSLWSPCKILTKMFVSFQAPSVWPFSWQQFGMYLITSNDLQHVNCWPVSMSSGLHSILQWVLVQKQSSGSRRRVSVSRFRPTLENISWLTPNCSKLKGKSFSKSRWQSLVSVQVQFARNSFETTSLVG